MGRSGEPRTTWKEKVQTGAEEQGPADWKWPGEMEKQLEEVMKARGILHIDGPCLMHIPGSEALPGWLSQSIPFHSI